MPITKKCLLRPTLFATIGAWSVLLSASSDSVAQEVRAGCASETQASAFIPIDSWIYPAVMRLQGMGYVDTVFLGMRPWNQEGVGHMLDEAEPIIADAKRFGDPTADYAKAICDAVAREIHFDENHECLRDSSRAVRVESAYSALRGLSGTPLRDSYHLGATIVNDFGRPYENGLNNYSGLSGYANAGRFMLYARGEFQDAPSATGYSTALASTLSSSVDNIPFVNPATGLPFSQTTIPMGPISQSTKGQVLEAYALVNLHGHAVSFGKEDEWLGPGRGGAMAYSNNAENIYALHIDRTDPLYIPILSELTGPFRYEFLVGPLKGHTFVPGTPASRVNPGAPWVHVEKISFRPTRNLEFGFERTVIWGGKGHEPITLKTFLRSFFSTSAPNGTVKNSRRDPGARFGAFDFSYRLPFLRNWLTLYSDSEVHDDVSPIDAPRRASIRPGLYLSHFPGLHQMDLRVEAVLTDPSISNSQGGHFMYYEGVQRQGYTNNGQLFGDWIGREDKGGQAFLNWNLSPREWIQIGYRNQKAAKDFIFGGTTLNDVDFNVVKRIRTDVEVRANFTLEQWKAPIYAGGQPVYPARLQTVTETTIQLTWFPQWQRDF